MAQTSPERYRQSITRDQALRSTSSSTSTRRTILFILFQPGGEKALDDFVADFWAAGEETIPALFRHPDWSYAEVVRIHEGWSQGVDQSPESARLFEDFVPSTTRFLSGSGGELLGVVNVRHRLNDFLERFGGHIGYSVRPSARRQGHAKRLLEHGLGLARDLGIERVTVTCEPGNVGSAKVIESCGGVLQESFFHEAIKAQVNLYWITL